jgi:hypothetical protein
MALSKRSATECDHRLSLPRIVVAYGDALPMLIYKIWIKPLFRKSGSVVVEMSGRTSNSLDSN